jgi:hypothetical protein
MDISVIIPSYRRCEDLDRCLRALARQQRPADEVVVVARADDAPTLALLSRPTWCPSALAVSERAVTDVRLGAVSASIAPIGMQQQGRTSFDQEMLPW